MVLQPGFLIGNPKDRVRQPLLEAGIVAKLLKQLRVVGQHTDNHFLKRTVMLEPRSSLV